MGWIVIVAIVAIVAFYAAAEKFYQIAKMKGHDDRSYFWWSFLLPFVGYAMVIALPKVDNVPVSEDDIPEI